MFRRIALIIIVGLSFSQISTVYACSGYPYFGLSDLPSADILAKVTVIETDDRGYSAVVQVEEYYKGEGEEFLTIMRYSPALQSVSSVRGYSTGCLYSGVGSRLYEDAEMYIGLQPNGDGTYSDYIGGSAHFYAIDGIVTYQEGITEGFALEWDDPLESTESELIDLMLEVGERDTPLEPTPNRYPLSRFLNITTEDGTRYQLNPDRSISLMNDENLIAQSPDGAHLALREDDTSIMLNFAYSSPSQGITVTGQNAKFTNDSNFVAVWDDTQLSLYAFSNVEQEIYGQAMGLYTLAELDTDNITNLVWSADSSTLAWQETEGIYRWNINEQAEPISLDINIEQVELSAISTYGRYVKTLYPSQDWEWYDTQTNTTLEQNQLISFDEQYVINTTLVMNENASCSIPLQANCPIIMNGTPQRPDFTFQVDNTLYTIFCDEEANCHFYRTLLEPYMVVSSYSSGPYPIIPVISLAYDQSYNIIALVSNDYEIHFGLSSPNQSLEDRNYVDLSDEVDSPIVSISWGQPTFYEYDVMQQTLYLPND